MAPKLHHLLSSVKDKATLIATFTTPVEIAVIRATQNHPSSSPPSQRHLSALLSFGRSSRLTVSTLARSFSSRLSSSRRHPCSVLLKCLVCIHHLLSRGSFIIVDTLTSSLLPSSGRRCPLNLSSFRDPCSLALSAWVRWYARLIELLVRVKAFDHLIRDDAIAERLMSLLNGSLTAELESLVAVVEEISRAPDTLALEDNLLVFEVVRLAEEERLNMLHGIRLRVQEVKERAAHLGFADSVELVCLLRRLEDCGGQCREKDLFWREVREVREMVERREGEERGRVRRERVGESARITATFRDGCVRFGSDRWL